ncbi:MAG: hypothetical protein ACAH06_02220 [Methylophilaceae bacterium]
MDQSLFLCRLLGWCRLRLMLLRWRAEHAAQNVVFVWLGGLFTRGSWHMSAPNQIELAEEITPQMLAAGVSVFIASGVVDDPLGADTLLVSEIFQAMRRAQKTRLEGDKGNN